jgi:hypothetical protein
MKAGLSILKQLVPIKYKFKTGNSLNLQSDKELHGLSAQDVQLVYPEAVVVSPKTIGKTTTRVNHPPKKDGSAGFDDVESPEPDQTDYLGIDMTKIRYLMINAIKELDDRLTKLEDKKNG